MTKNSYKISMPNEIKIGDTSNLTQDGRYDYFFSKTFRGRNQWLGELNVVTEINEQLKERLGLEFSEASLFAIFAPNIEFLDAYKSGQCYREQKIATTELGNNTECYVLKINDKTLDIYAGANGANGSIFEIYTENKLEGLIISLTGLSVEEFDGFLGQTMYLFNV